MYKLKQSLDTEEARVKTELDELEIKGDKE